MLGLISTVPTEHNPESGPSAFAATYHQTSAAWTDTLAAPRFRRSGAQRLRRGFPTQPQWLSQLDPVGPSANPLGRECRAIPTTGNRRRQVLTGTLGG